MVSFVGTWMTPPIAQESPVLPVVEFRRRFFFLPISELRVMYFGFGFLLYFSVQGTYFFFFFSSRVRAISDVHD